MSATTQNPSATSPRATSPERFKWSASRLKRLLQCPRQFKYVYVDGLPTVLTAPLLFGKTVHAVLCSAHETQMESGELPPLSDLLPRFDELWQQGLEAEPPLFRPSHPTPEKYVTIGHEMLRVFHDAHRNAPPPLAVEIPFEMEVEIGEDGPERKESKRTVTLRGVIDRLDEVALESGEPALVIVDYKSGQKKPSRAELEEEIQLTVYALAAQQLWQMPVAQLEIHFLRDGLVFPTQRSLASMEWLTGQVLTYAVRAVERGNYPPAPGYWCRWCDFAYMCEQENSHEKGR